MSEVQSKSTDILDELRSGNCGDPCRVIDARSGCRCAIAADEIERLRAVLADFGKQMLPAEVEGFDDSPDYLGAYETMVAKAREALA